MLGVSPPLYAVYDPNPNGQFGIICTYENGNKKVLIGIDSILTYKNFLIKDSTNKNVRVSHFNRFIIDSCQFIGTLDPFKSINGTINLSRVDITNGVFSGTFEFMIDTKDCGNYKITNGRFDYKF